jgi:rRNA large subunit m3Psi methyltransferase RlmH
VAESRAATAELRKREEAAQLERHAPGGAALILLDERGKTPDSPGFRGTAGRFRDDGRRDLVIAIGGPDGLDPDLRAKADAVICFGRMTWPHQLVRIMAAEQLYRASPFSPAIPITGLNAPRMHAAAASAVHGVFWHEGSQRSDPPRTIWFMED